MDKRRARYACQALVVLRQVVCQLPAFVDHVDKHRLAALVFANPRMHLLNWLRKFIVNRFRILLVHFVLQKIKNCFAVNFFSCWFRRTSMRMTIFLFPNSFWRFHKISTRAAIVFVRFMDVFQWRHVVRRFWNLAVIHGEEMMVVSMISGTLEFDPGVLGRWSQEIGPTLTTHGSQRSQRVLTGESAEARFHDWFGRSNLLEIVLVFRIYEIQFSLVAAWRQLLLRWVACLDHVIISALCEFLKKRISCAVHDFIIFPHRYVHRALALLPYLMYGAWRLQNLVEWCWRHSVGRYSIQRWQHGGIHERIILIFGRWHFQRLHWLLNQYWFVIDLYWFVDEVRFKVPIQVSLFLVAFLAGERCVFAPVRRFRAEIIRLTLWFIDCTVIQTAIVRQIDVVHQNLRHLLRLALGKVLNLLQILPAFLIH